MASSALITGGTGGLGAAVTQAFLDAGWRVVVPVFDDAERDRLPAHERLVLEPADLFDADSARAVTALAAGDGEAPLRRGRQPRRRLRHGRPRARDAGRRLRGPAAPEPAPDVPRLPRRDRAPARRRRRRDRLRLLARRAAAVLRRGGLRRRQGGGAGVRRRPARRVRRRRDPRQRDPAERHRHARPTAARCPTPTTAAGSRRRRSPPSCASCARTQSGIVSGAHVPVYGRA